MQVANAAVEHQPVANDLSAPNDGDAIRRQNGVDFNDAAEVRMKHEVKVESEIEMEDLIFNAFDPIENKANRGAANGEAAVAEAAECSNGPSKSSAPSISPKQPKNVIKRKLFKCTDCNYSTVYKRDLTRHQQIHDKRGIKPFKCKRCDYSTIRRDNLKRHRRIHDHQKMLGIQRDPVDGSFECTFCAQRFQRWEDISGHLNRRHKNNHRRFEQNSKKDRHET